ncbi:MAG: VWA domain-containing protein [Candidatus Berkelbacteria bacterium]|nr:VWA domain-containing protein [Candidatus Berkelbacteria bacterium]
MTEKLKQRLSKEEFWLSLTEEQKKELEKKRRILSSLAYFIGKDFNIPVNFNKPGEGWNWDFEKNEINIDPIDLIERPFDYLRFVISHEGGHRRLSRTNFIPRDIMEQPGFMMMMNAIEDPRVNNAIADYYPAFREQMILAYEEDLRRMEERESEIKDEAGFVPDYFKAGLEYIRLWYKNFIGEEAVVQPDLSEEIREVVEKTVALADASWWTYPTKVEADESAATVEAYSKTSYEINLNEIWPEFKKLIKVDREKAKISELIKKLQEAISKTKNEGDPGSGPEPQIGQNSETDLSREEAEELATILSQSNIALPTDEAKPNDGGEPGSKSAISIDQLSEETIAKIKDFFDRLPEKAQEEIAKKATELLLSLEAKFIEVMKHDIEEREASEVETNSEQKTAKKVAEKPKKIKRELGEQKAIEDLRREIAKICGNNTIYEEEREKVLPVIDRLENELRQIFRQRRQNRWQSGKRSGPSISLVQRISEIGQGIPAFDSRAWQKRELPQEKDYAFSLLVDLSGSMRGEKIRETFKAVIVLAEVLNRLSIKTEILGFNDHITEYQKFGEKMSNQIRDALPGMLGEVGSGSAAWNDDGWALLEVSKRLEKRIEQEKFLIVLSDGLPCPSRHHRSAEFDLGAAVAKVLTSRKQKLIGLGIGQGTGHVANYYPNHLADIDLDEMSVRLSGVIREVIEHGERFK